MSIKQSAGFTIIEVLVTLVVLGVFLALFFQTYLAAQSQQLTADRRGVASEIAYSNLKKYPKKLASFPCTTDMDQSGASAATKTGLLIGSSNAALNPSTYSFSPETGSRVSRLGAYVLQTVKLYAPRGCVSVTAPYKIESWVEYGQSSTQTEKVVHAAFIN